MDQPQENKPNPEEALPSDLGVKISEAVQYFVSYLSSYVDMTKSTFRNALTAVVLTIFFIALKISIVFLSLGFLFYGIAAGLGEILGGRFWAGSLITGAFFSTGLFTFIKYKTSWNQKTILKERQEQYEHMVEEQRQQFGHDIEERAEEKS